MIPAVLALYPIARSGKLQLDRAIVTREVGFYGLSILLLYIALQDRRPADDDELEEDHIFINFFDACLLFGGYIAYVLVCANMQTIVACFQKPKGNELTTDEEKKKFYGAVEQRSKVRRDGTCFVGRPRLSNPVNLFTFHSD